MPVNHEKECLLFWYKQVIKLVKSNKGHEILALDLKTLTHMA